MIDSLLKFLGNLQSYFNDFIGLIAPALIFYTLLFPALGTEYRLDIFTRFGDLSWLPILAALFATGHVLGALGDAVSRAWYALLGLFVKQYEGRFERQIEDRKNSAEVVAFRMVAERAVELPLGELRFSALRSIAMTMSSDGEELGRRFRFTATFCRATSAAVALLAILNICAAFSGVRTMGEAIGYAALAVGVVFVLRMQHQQYTRRAEFVPFGAALGDVCVAKLQIKQQVAAKPSQEKAGAEAEVAASGGLTPPKAPDVFPI